jgi:hypothetical protein
MEIPGRKIESHQGIIRANWKKLIGYLWALYCEPTDMMAFTQEPILLKACQTG